MNILHIDKQNVIMEAIAVIEMELVTLTSEQWNALLNKYGLYYDMPMIIDFENRKILFSEVFVSALSAYIDTHGIDGLYNAYKKGKSYLRLCMHTYAQIKDGRELVNHLTNIEYEVAARGEVLIHVSIDDENGISDIHTHGLGVEMSIILPSHLETRPVIELMNNMIKSGLYDAYLKRISERGYRDICQVILTDNAQKGILVSLHYVKATKPEYADYIRIINNGDDTSVNAYKMENYYIDKTPSREVNQAIMDMKLNQYKDWIQNRLYDYTPSADVIKMAMVDNFFEIMQNSYTDFAYRLNRVAMRIWQRHSSTLRHINVDEKTIENIMLQSLALYVRKAVDRYYNLAEDIQLNIDEAEEILHIIEENLGIKN